MASARPVTQMAEINLRHPHSNTFGTVKTAAAPSSSLHNRGGGATTLARSTVTGHRPDTILLLRSLPTLGRCCFVTENCGKSLAQAVFTNRRRLTHADSTANEHFGILVMY